MEVQQFFSSIRMQHACISELWSIFNENTKKILASHTLRVSFRILFQHILHSRKGCSKFQKNQNNFLSKSDITGFQQLCQNIANEQSNMQLEIVLKEIISHWQMRFDEERQF